MKKICSLFALATLVGLVAISAISSADARILNQQDGTYVQDRLPNGEVTGPLARDANGG
jgi:hypothetical protein